VSNTISIKSHKGIYTVEFKTGILKELSENSLGEVRLVIDKRVAELYERDLAATLASESVLLVDAGEESKNLQMFPAYIKRLMSTGMKRSHSLLAIGGGVIQDITCFLASTLFRGVSWSYYPTTLLAQADSCIGSKSSINVDKLKNVLGTFLPPDSVTIDTGLLNTLEPKDVLSGIGEMLKVHAIDGPKSFDDIAGQYDLLREHSASMDHFIYNSLLIKKRLIELDEFDRGPRNVMNYGHSFGHAIEAATDYAIPHGIAITIGMDMANFVSVQLGQVALAEYLRMKPTLVSNYSKFSSVPIPHEPFFDAISKDKKNPQSGLRLILLDSNAVPSVGTFPNDQRFTAICEEFFDNEIGSL